jgi:hypothetical protein
LGNPSNSGRPRVSLPAPSRQKRTPTPLPTFLPSQLMTVPLISLLARPQPERRQSAWSSAILPEVAHFLTALAATRSQGKHEPRLLCRDRIEGAERKAFDPAADMPLLKSEAERVGRCAFLVIDSVISSIQGIRTLRSGAASTSCRVRRESRLRRAAPLACPHSVTCLWGCRQAGFSCHPRREQQRRILGQVAGW